jgi:capsular polysaccharide biosynthesis protein
MSQKEETEGLEFLELLIKKWKTIVLAVIIAAAGSAIVTAFLNKEYYAYGIVFPASNNSVEASAENPNVGYDFDADRLLQLLFSEQVFDSVVNKFDLDKYYGYNKSNQDWRDEVKESYSQNITFTRTQYMSVVIGAQTREPELSRDIVNYILDLVNRLRNRVFKINQLQALESLELETENQKKVVDSLEKEVALLRSKTDVELLIMPNSQYVIQSKTNKESAAITTELERAMNQYIYEQFRYNDVNGRYEKTKALYDRPLTRVFVVDRATASYKKVFPSYTMNISLAAVFTLIFTIIYLVLSRRINGLRSKITRA